MATEYDFFLGLVKVIAWFCTIIVVLDLCVTVFIKKGQSDPFSDYGKDQVIGFAFAVALLCWITVAVMTGWL